jgi:ribonuclease HII
MSTQISLSFDSVNDASSLVIAGVDEVGRGPLIGNVVTAAVILPDDCPLPLNDSKKLSEKKRDALYEQILDEAVDYAIAFATPEEIDQYNILQATLMAMQRAVSQLSQPFDEVWVDGNRCPKFAKPCQAIVKGDGKVPAISAASILAKVTRDREMLALHEQYPQYGFAQHKGYPTAAHLKAIQKYGLIEGYRTSFKPVQKLLANS